MATEITLIENVADFAINSNASAAWDACDSPVLYAVDPESGEEVAQVRHLAGDTWLYVDSENGFRVHTTAEVEGFALTAGRPE